ncbi:hypothetical protein D1155_12305 [Anaerotruncus sp. 80]|jgi:hypothetical protein|uniref:Uncharacterized protein n=2 Tax=Bacillota TaxID=1239 RepID=A0A845QMX7_9FIRM|nr:hypothetical protein [Anaerotruncus colihominis]NCE98593.1 hypothetical protein [Emergencia sp. 1XD21-10]NCF03086.1 hypothetical protein [Anaerotruncus sp. 80]
MWAECVSMIFWRGTTLAGHDRTDPGAVSGKFVEADMAAPLFLCVIHCLTGNIKDICCSTMK